jgi:hypothetical protein
MAEQNCPRCQQAVTNLIPVEQNLRQKFNLVRPGTPLPVALCSNCQNEVRTFLEQGSITLAREKSKEESKMKLWRSRVALLKRARNLMKKKVYGEAIISYEKYLKVLEVVFEVTEEGLRPEIFKERMATKELTIITSVYWDLLRVYDTNEKYRPRMIAASNKLIQFAPFTPIILDIVKKAEAYKKQARNSDIFKTLIRELMYKRNHCFIATSVFEEPGDWKKVDVLRDFRDRVLFASPLGILAIKSYYRFSPKVARFLDKNVLLKQPIKLFLGLVVRLLELFKI